VIARNDFTLYSFYDASIVDKTERNGDEDVNNMGDMSGPEE
jgi:hypothetical protein